MPFRRRLLVMYLGFCLGLGLIWVRAAQLQALEGDYWEAQAQSLRQINQSLEGQRGAVLDADGQVLAQDVPVPQLVLTPDDWLRRHRVRCLHCGLLHCYDPSPTKGPPKRCSCQSGLTRTEAIEAARFEPLPPGDVASIEAALGLEAGSLAQAASQRMAEIDALMAAELESLRAEGLDEPFAQSKIRQQRADFMHRPVVIATDVAPEVLRAVATDETATLQGLSIRSVLRRRYPLGDFAPQLLGFSSLVAGPQEYQALRKQYGDAVSTTARVGRRGLERAFNGQLYGAPGRRVMERGESGLFSEVVREQPPGPGRALRLSLSARASQRAQVTLEDYATRENFFPGGRPSAAFVAMDADTGEILLWADTPRFDLNTELDDIFRESPRDGLPDRHARQWNPRGSVAGDEEFDLEEFRRDLTVPEPRSLSRVSQVPVEPGSTFKVLIALAMLDSGIALPYAGDDFLCQEDARKPKCHNCGHVDLVEAIEHSCNRWFAFSLRDHAQWNTWRHTVPAFLARLGIGQSPGTEVPEWSSGQFLRPWWDFPPIKVVEAAQQWLSRDMGDAAPELVVRADPQLVATVAGDPQAVGALLGRTLKQIAEDQAARKVRVSVGVESIEQDEVLLRFDLRLAEMPLWSSLPSLAASDLPPGLESMAARGRAGTLGRLAQGGSVWFTARFERSVGRASPLDPMVIRPQDGRNVAIGQGPVLVTPLQVARAMAVFANGGRLVEPHTVVQVGDLAVRPPSTDLHLARAHLDLVRKGMWSVVYGSHGTAREPAWQTLPATVYGKTGTAQVGPSWRPYPQQGSDEPWHHWFAGYVETRDARRIAFACVLHARREGAASATAVKATYEILKDYLAGPAQRADPDSGR